MTAYLTSTYNHDHVQTCVAQVKPGVALLAAAEVRIFVVKKKRHVNVHRSAAAFH